MTSVPTFFGVYSNEWNALVKKPFRLLYINRGRAKIDNAGASFLNLNDCGTAIAKTVSAKRAKSASARSAVHRLPGRAPGGGFKRGGSQ